LPSLSISSPSSPHALRAPETALLGAVPREHTASVEDGLYQAVYLRHYHVAYLRHVVNALRIFGPLLDNRMKLLALLLGRSLSSTTPVSAILNLSALLCHRPLSRRKKRGVTTASTTLSSLQKKNSLMASSAEGAPMLSSREPYVNTGTTAGGEEFNHLPHV